MNQPLLLGCIADDFTGASDLANTLAREGMRTTQYIDIPADKQSCDCEAAIISLKSRSVDAADAIEQSLNALRWLRAQGATQFLFKYCSTFDSTPAGNIGPVAEALAAELGTNAVVVCPAFPTTGRTVYQGHLFVFDKLLNESGLENHPLNPMTDADIRRWLALQATGKVGHISQSVVNSGSDAIKQALDTAATENEMLVVVDATADQDLRTIGTACADAKLITGGSGIALGLPENFRQQGKLGNTGSAFEPQSGTAAIVCGSCSQATRAQIEAYTDGPKIALNIEAILDRSCSAEDIFNQQSDSQTTLFYSSADPQVVSQLQQKHGIEKVAHAIENFFGELAVKLVAADTRRLVVAGGETSGAVISALNLQAFNIGPEIDPGVPALSTVEGPPLAVALKSGNFGSKDFFSKALGQLAAASA